MSENPVRACWRRRGAQNGSRRARFSKRARRSSRCRLRGVCLKPRVDALTFRKGLCVHGRMPPFLPYHFASCGDGVTSRPMAQRNARNIEDRDFLAAPTARQTIITVTKIGVIIGDVSAV